jgi:Holliday junction resolvase RusA-like endonuclease
MRPIPWGSKEWNWRKALAEQARQVIDPDKLAKVSKTSQFTVKMIFRMSRDSVKKADLDNLAKPVLDTLFKPYYPQVKDPSLTGAIFDLDDSQVYRLELEKRTDANGEEGIDIIVAWE